MANSESTAGGATAANPPRSILGFNWTYWNSNIIEMWERLAYYTLRPIAPIYIMQATEPGGLHLTAETKGWIYMWWAICQSFLPMITGGYADRYGYKRTLFCSITANLVGYLMMAYMHSYYGFFAGVLVLATGTAFFKPSLQATLAHNLSKSNASLGWGIFYLVVNLGSVFGHYISPLLLGPAHGEAGWRTLFLACAGFTAINYVLLFTYRDVPSGASKTENPLAVFARTIRNILEPRLITWLLIMSCFWMMMYQLWDLQPNFIEDWIDSSMVAAHVPFESWHEMGDRGLLRVPQQVLISLNALLIVFLMVPVSWAVRRMRTLSAMFLGMLVATGGLLVAGLTGHGLILLLGILFFSLGEMLTGPKKNEYLGLIAPPGKKGLYLGYVNIPVGVGVGLGSLIAGHVYGHWGEKATLALKELASQPALIARAAQCSDWSDSLQLIPELTGITRRDAFALAQDDLKQDAAGTAVALRAAFRYDAGQVANLAYIHLGQTPAYQAPVRKGVAGELRTLAEQVERTAAAAETATQPAQSAAELRDLAQRIESGGVAPEVGVLARFVYRMPKWIGKKPFEALEIARDQMQTAARQTVDRSTAAEQLWQLYGEEPEVLNNLALEYVAQETYVVRDAVEQLATRGFENPLEEIPEKVGIGRTKAFATLSAALGATASEVMAALDAQTPATATPAERLGLYLVKRDHVRFQAVARHAWPNDVKLLRELIDSDPGAKSVVEQNIDRRSLKDRLMGLFRGGGQGDLYERLAPKTDLIQKALAAKDWSRAPEDALRLLALNPYEARALVAAEIKHTPQQATLALWRDYSPQYKVWIPFAAVGVAASIALYVFGQMAKRWKDMNA